MIPPDQNLLFVRGFDASARQFKYEVNQRFGSTRPQQATTYALPFVSLGVSVDIGMPRERQVLTQRLDAGRTQPGTRFTEQMLENFGKATIPNPIMLIFQQGDSLGLTRIQADSLAALNVAFTEVANLIWVPASRYFAALPDRYNTREAYDRYVAARVRTVDYLITLVPHVKGILTPSQQRKLPPLVRNLLDVRVLGFMRTSTLGDGSSVVIR
jgi:hypothetical protein